MAEAWSIPEGKSLQVRIIDTTTKVRLNTQQFMAPLVPGFEVVDGMAYSFLLEHPSGRKLLFDLGMRKDPQNLSKPISDRLVSNNWVVSAEKNVADILEENGVKCAEVEGIIWSHWHWDHTGDPSTFPRATSLVVGPGFKKKFVPGWPENPYGLIKVDDYRNRELVEIDFNGSFYIGDFPAHDYFGDGSLYLLDAPGHAIGHLCALARTSYVSSPPVPTFMFLGGDFAHHAGEFRPSEHLPIPRNIAPNPLRHVKDPPLGTLATLPACPGHVFEELNHSRGREAPNQEFFTTVPPEGSSTLDAAQIYRTINKVQALDCRDDIFVICAHDDSLLGIVDLFPKYATDWKTKGWHREGKWAFLKNFASALHHPPN